MVRSYVPQKAPEKRMILRCIRTVSEIVKPLSKYCYDNKIQQPVYEVDMVRNNKVWICCRSGSYSGIAIGDTYEDVLLKAIEKFVANCQCSETN
jgi:hypothetical protein